MLAPLASRSTLQALWQSWSVGRQADEKAALKEVYTPCSPLSLSPGSQADRSSHLVRLITVSSGAVVTLAGTPGVSGSADGVGTAAAFNDPTGVAIDAAGSFVLIVR